MITIVAARNYINVIGRDGNLPWHHKEDLKFFKEYTMGKKIIMGRKTFESVPPLPGREIYVLTRDKTYSPEGAKVVHSIEEIVALSKNEEIVIAGGYELYKMFINIAHKMWISTIYNFEKGDTYFPEIDRHYWKYEYKKPMGNGWSLSEFRRN